MNKPVQPVQNIIRKERPSGRGWLLNSKKVFMDRFDFQPVQLNIFFFSFESVRNTIHYPTPKIPNGGGVGRVDASARDRSLFVTVDE